MRTMKTKLLRTIAAEDRCRERDVKREERRRRRRLRRSERHGAANSSPAGPRCTTTPRRLRSRGDAGSCRCGRPTPTLGFADRGGAGGEQSWDAATARLGDADVRDPGVVGDVRAGAETGRSLDAHRRAQALRHPPGGRAARLERATAADVEAVLREAGEVASEKGCDLGVWVNDRRGRRASPEAHDRRSLDPHGSRHARALADVSGVAMSKVGG
jgi:hypothetical protein